MNPVEERLRATLEAATGTVRQEDLPPFPRPAERSAAKRSLRPLVAALAVAVLLVGTAAVLSWRGGEATPAAAPLRGPIMLALLDSTEHPGEPATIRDRTTGRLIRKIPWPRGLEGWAAGSGTLDNHTFYLLGELKGAAKRLYRLRVDGMGRIAELSPVTKDLPAETHDYLAVSADGDTLAVSVDTSQGPGKPSSEIRVLSRRTGGWRSWRTPTPGLAQDLSLNADGTVISFLWMASPQGEGLRVLKIGGPGQSADLVKASHRVEPGKGQSFGEIYGPRLSADGASVFMVSSEADADSRLLKVSIKNSATPTVYLQRPVRTDDPPAPVDGAPPPVLGNPFTAFTIACATPDLGHIRLRSRDTTWWIDTRTRRTTLLPPLKGTLVC